MTISTYDELKTALGPNGWTANNATSGHEDEFIDNVEGEFARRLRIRAMEATATGNFTAGNPDLALPTGFVELRTFSFVPVASVSRTPAFKTVEQITRLGTLADGEPLYYTFANGGIRMAPPPDATYAYTLLYYKKITPLDGTNTTNWLLTNYPDAYLAGSLVWAFAWLRDFDAAAGWKQKFETSVAEIIAADSRERIKGPTVDFDSELLGRRVYNILTDGP